MQEPASPNPAAHACALCGTPMRARCPSCGLEELVTLPIGIVGRVACIEGAGRWLPGIVIEPQDSSSSASIRVLCPGVAESRTVQRAAIRPQRIPGSETALSPAGALLRCIGTYTEEVDFEDTHLREAAIALAGDDERRRVLLALDAAAIGDEITLASLDLREPLDSLVRATALVAQGRVPDPAQTMTADKPNPLMRSIYILQAGDALEEGSALGEPHKALIDDPMVRLASEAGRAATSLDALSRAAEVAQGEVKGRVDDLLARWGSDRSIALCRDIAPSAIVLHGLTRHTKGAEMPVKVLEGQSAVVIDTLIDKGFVSPRVLARLRATMPERGAYWGARLAPSTLSDEDCRAMGLKAELARRLLEVEPEADISHLAGDPQVDSILAARAYLSGDDAALDVYREARPAQDVEALMDLRELMRGEYRGLPPTHLLAERTLWPAIADRMDEDFLEQGSRSPTGSVEREFVAWASLRNALAHLTLGDWSSAERSATRALGCADREYISDEALNLRAVSRWFAGRTPEAVSDYEEAIRGSYNQGLVANSIIVALSEPSERQARLLAQTLELAPTPAAAGRAALFIAERLRRESEMASLPQEIILKLRQTLLAPIGLDDFRGLLAVLSDVDGDWLAGAALSMSTHAKTPEAAIYQARCRGIFEWVAALVEYRKIREPWLEAMNVSMCLMLCNQFMEQGQQSVAADLALELIDGNVHLPSNLRVQLVALAIREVAFIRAATPSLKSVPAWLEDSRLELFLRTGKTIDAIPVESREQPREIYEACARAILNIYAQTLETLAQVLPPLMFPSVAVQFRGIFASIEKSQSMPTDVKQQAGELRRMLR